MDQERVGRPPLSEVEVEGHLAQNRSWEAAPRVLSPRGRASDSWGQGEKTEALVQPPFPVGGQGVCAQGVWRGLSASSGWSPGKASRLTQWAGRPAPEDGPAE